MTSTDSAPPAGDARALVAIDLGAESCRVSLLRWRKTGLEIKPEIQLMHRIANGPETRKDGLFWPIDRIVAGIEDGLRKAALAAPEGIRSIAVDGWAVDYVRLPSGASQLHLADPYCYRDERTIAAKETADKLVAPEKFFCLTGAQPLRINTAYQLFADNQAGIDPATPWLSLPEYLLFRLGGKRVAEYTNATHTGLVDINTNTWSEPIFTRLGLSIEAAPPIVPSGTRLGQLTGSLALLPELSNTELIAPACHDTASAIAAVTADLSHTAYLVAGTWSLLGTVVEEPITSKAAQLSGFTNQGEAAGGYCFHTNINGMWLIKQCLDCWQAAGREIDIPTLVAEATNIADIPGLIDVNAPSLLLAGHMPERINAQLKAQGLNEIADTVGNEAIFARLIFASLAARYAEVIQNLASLTGRTFRQITILGGGNRNALLRELTAASTGLPVVIGEAEGSTLGNFAVQLAAHETVPGQRLSAESVRRWAKQLSVVSAPR